jgi:multidrug efflux pump subunit AcrA (membrane-fusion protein)
VDVGSEEAGARKLTGTLAVVTPENKIDLRKVDLGLETATKVEVKSGLSEGEMVVIGSRSGLQQGQEVRPKLASISTP